MLRLEARARAALDRITAAEGVSDNTAINEAIIEYDAKRTSVRDALLAQIVSEDRPLLDRLAE